jgi:hypothetical protein
MQVGTKWVALVKLEVDFSFSSFERVFDRTIDHKIGKLYPYL